MNFKDENNFATDFMGYGKKDKLKEITFNDVGYLNHDPNYIPGAVIQAGNL